MDHPEEVSGEPCIHQRRHQEWASEFFDESSVVLLKCQGIPLYFQSLRNVQPGLSVRDRSLIVNLKFFVLVMQ